jgi:hypothetical protein
MCRSISTVALAIDTDVENETSGVDADTRPSRSMAVAEVAFTMVSGSVADERAFSAMNFIKKYLRNRLDTNLEACLLVHMQDMFTTAIFPCEHLQERLKSM